MLMLMLLLMLDAGRSVMRIVQVNTDPGVRSKRLCFIPSITTDPRTSMTERGLGFRSDKLATVELVVPAQYNLLCCLPLPFFLFSSFTLHRVASVEFSGPMPLTFHFFFSPEPPPPPP